MERVRPLLAASVFGLVAVACGCGNQDSSQYRTYSPPVDAAADDQGGATSAATDSSPEALSTTSAQSPPIAETAPEPDATAVAPITDNAVANPAPADATAEPAVVPATAADDTPGEPSPSAPDVVTAAADSTLVAAVGTADITAALEPRETKLLIPEKTFRKEGGSLRVSYDDIDLLKVLNMEPVTPDAPDLFPAWLTELDGQRIRIRGYMRPGELSEELPFFVLARDTKACCFGPNTKAYDIIPVVMRDGVTTDYLHMTPFDLVGVFHINVEMDLDDPQKVEFLYFIDDAVLIDK